MEYNNWSTYTIFDDSRYTYSNGKQIQNVDNTYMGKITLRTALSRSRNIPALKAFQKTDNRKIIDFVTSIGITPEISNGSIHEAHAIGAFTGSNPLSMAGAYQIFSNGGYYYEPYSVNKIIFRNDNKTIEYSSPKVRVISDSTAYMITDVLKNQSEKKNLIAFIIACIFVVIYGYNRIHMTNHFLTDVCFGTLITYLIFAGISTAFIKTVD